MMERLTEENERIAGLIRKLDRITITLGIGKTAIIEDFRLVFRKGKMRLASRDGNLLRSWQGWVDTTYPPKLVLRKLGLYKTNLTVDIPESDGTVVITEKKLKIKFEFYK